MNQNYVAIAVIAAGLFWPQIKERLPDNIFPPAGPSAPSVATPDATAQAAVAPVAAALNGRPERAKFAGYFIEFGELIQKRPGDFKTVGDVIRQHEVASDVFADLNPGGATGLAAAVEQSMKVLLGDDDKAIDTASAVRAMNALAWACSQ
jgi:hypothetical protein